MPDKYRITIETNKIALSDFKQLESSLTERNFKSSYKDMEIKVTRMPGELHTLYSKTLNGNGYVEIFISYAKNVRKGLATDIRIITRNYHAHAGWKNITIRNEIDATGDFIYKELVKLVGEDNVAIWRVRESDKNYIMIFHRNIKSIDETNRVR